MTNSSYNSLAVEKKWRERWDADKLYQVDLDKAKQPFYNLTMFPYPSSAALHVGHVYCYGGVDTYGRYLRLKGFDVFEPMGFDAFGIHAENYALKIGEHPQVVVPRNIENFRDNQMKKLGTMFDWSRQLSTTDPEYYKWTQWIFLQMHAAGLVERRNEAVDYCPSCKTVLANEQVIDGACERCNTQVEQKALEQWFFKITEYAEELLGGLGEIDWPERTKLLQQNWIGKKVGIDIHYKIDGHEELAVTCFTTRPETNFGATFVVLAPEHALVDQIVVPEQRQAITDYREQVRLKNDMERTELSKEKTGVFTGAYCINDLNGERLPIWVGDFVLASFGTGAVVGVPAHDIRDFEFAQMAGIPVRRVLTRDGDSSEITAVDQVWEDDGTLVNSDFLNGMSWEIARVAVMDFIEENGWGKRTVSYRLHDWLISRQRYWGPPIPMIHCEACAVRDKATKVLILHGTSGSGEGNWFPWLRAKLEAGQLEVKTPTLPDTDAPDYDTRMAFLATELAGWVNENTIVIGHSSGAVTALHLAELHKLKKLILVAPYIAVPESQRAAYLEGFGEATTVAMERFCAHGFDRGKISGNVASIVALYGGQDRWADEGMQSLVQTALPTVAVRVFPNHHHFSGAATPKFPEILSELPPRQTGAGWRTVPEEQLPVILPKLDAYEPDGSGRGPLAGVEDFVHTTCPECGGPAKRETDVSDTFLDSAWYQLRYPSTEFHDKPFDPARIEKWGQVDLYIGGIEHATMHLLYFRFVTMMLNNLGHLPFREPAKKMRHQGLIIKDGAKMSKSRGNVVNPDEYIQKYGADAFRMYMLFIGPYEEGGEFNDRGILGVTRFLDKVWGILTVPRDPEGGAASDDEGSRGVQPAQDRISPASGEAVRNSHAFSMTKLHATIKKVGEEMEVFQFNTSIAALMELSNWIKENAEVFSEEQWAMLKQTLPILLAPFAPHFAEELWQALGFKYSVHNQVWPTYDEKELIVSSVEIVIQINGKIRSRFTADPQIGEAQAKEIALADDRIKPWIEGKAVRKVIYVPGKLVNVVVG